MTSTPNLDPPFVASFCDEWQRFDQQGMPPPAAPLQTEFVTDLIALTVYWPLSRLASLAESAGLPVASFPLSYYRPCSFYTMRTDTRDRFGTPLEQRFNRAQIRTMCTAAGLLDLRFSPRAPYWSVVGVNSCCNTSSFT